MESIDCLSRLVAAFGSGTPILNIAERSNDAPFILEGEEFDLEWREILFPPAALPSSRILRPKDFAELQQQDAGALTLRCPPLVLIAPTEFKILDGWHRITSAQVQEAPLISLLVAKVPIIIPA